VRYTSHNTETAVTTREAGLAFCALRASPPRGSISGFRLSGSGPDRSSRNPGKFDPRLTPPVCSGLDGPLGPGPVRNLAGWGPVCLRDPDSAVSPAPITRSVRPAQLNLKQASKPARAHFVLDRARPGSFRAQPGFNRAQPGFNRAQPGLGPGSSVLSPCSARAQPGLIRARLRLTPCPTCSLLRPQHCAISTHDCAADRPLVKTRQDIIRGR
jgi:hypothetical protein